MLLQLRNENKPLKRARTISIKLEELFSLFCLLNSKLFRRDEINIKNLF